MGFALIFKDDKYIWSRSVVESNFSSDLSSKLRSCPLLLGKSGAKFFLAMLNPFFCVVSRIYLKALLYWINFSSPVHYGSSF